MRHRLEAVVPCGPGEQAVQWKCTCGVYGKPVVLSRLSGVSMVERHKRHERRHR